MEHRRGRNAREQTGARLKLQRRAGVTMPTEGLQHERAMEMKK